MIPAKQGMVRELVLNAGKGTTLEVSKINAPVL